MLIDPHEPQIVYLLWLVLGDDPDIRNLAGIHWTVADAKRVAEIGWPKTSPATWIESVPLNGPYLLLDYRPAHKYWYFVEQEYIEPTQVKAVPEGASRWLC